MTEQKKGRPLRRRSVLKAIAAGAGILATPSLLRNSIRRAHAAPGTIRMMGGPTVALKDWSQFEKDTGLKMEFTSFNVDDVGALYNEILANDAGERFDLINTLAGV